MNPHSQLNTDALHITTLLIYMADEHPLPPGNRIQRPCIPLHCLYILQINPPPTEPNQQRPCI